MQFLLGLTLLATVASEDDVCEGQRCDTTACPCGCECGNAADPGLCYAPDIARTRNASFFTNFSIADKAAWDLQSGCSHCSGSTHDECTQMTPTAVSWAEVQDSHGARITTRPLQSASKCGGQCESGHLEWRESVRFGTFKLRARWFKGALQNSSTASGFIGLFGTGNGAGSITFIFHGEGWNDGSSNDFAHTFQSEVYQAGQNHNERDIQVSPNLHNEVVEYELEWRPDRVHWRVNGVLVRTHHPSTSVSIPQQPLKLRIHSRSGYCSSMPRESSFAAELFAFEYLPLPAQEQAQVRRNTAQVVD